MRPDRVAGVMGVVLGAALVAGSIQLGLGRLTDPAPGFFPFVAGATLAAFAVTLVVGRAGVGSTVIVRPPARAPLQLVALMAVYAMLFERLGYTLATILVALAILRMAHLPWVRAAVASVFLSLATYLVFAGLLGVELPPGPIGRLF
jgi:hypothetical protein